MGHINKLKRLKAAPPLPPQDTYHQTHYFKKNERRAVIVVYSKAMEIEFYEDPEYKQKVDWDDPDVKAFGRGGKTNFFEFVGSENMDKNMAKLAQTISKAAGGSKEASATFAKMGIEVKNSDGTLKNSEQVLMEMADAFQKLPAGTERATLAMDVFGKSGASMVTMLKDGSGALRDNVFQKNLPLSLKIMYIIGRGKENVRSDFTINNHLVSVETGRLFFREETQKDGKRNEGRKRKENGRTCNLIETFFQYIKPFIEPFFQGLSKQIYSRGSYGL